MTQLEYEQKKRECWEEYWRTHKTYLHGDSAEIVLHETFTDAFDRAYALGKKKEIISEDVEKAAEEYAEPSRTWASGAETQEIKDAFKAGANFTLGKQEQDADSFEIGDKVRVKETNQIGTIIEPYSNDVGYRVYFDDGDGGEDAEFTADQLELYKKTIESKDAEDTAIQGWVARDFDGDVFLYQNEPDRNEIAWNGYMMHSLPIDSFPDITWDDEPQECEIIIRRKKK